MYLISPLLFLEHSSVKRSSTYKLYGISHHSGSLNGGHYIGEVKNLDTGAWYNCNDSHCSKISGGADNQSASAYVLFYIQQ
jgi:ubiquitin C-terminal hydrolase